MSFLEHKPRIVFGDKIILYPGFAQPRGSCCFGHFSVEEPIKFVFDRDTKLTLNDWVPKKLEENDNFGGVNRNRDRVRLAGIVYSKRGPWKEESLIELLALMNREGAAPDVILSNLCLADIPHEHGFIKTRYGRLFNRIDTNLKDDEIYVLTSDTWIIVNDILLCTRPGWNGRLI